jgi:uncharacterized protein (DUF362 family)
VQTGNSNLAILKVHDDTKLYDYIKEALNLTGIQIPRKRRIIIKPNLCDIRGSDSGLTTDVRLVDALIRFLNDNYDPIKIAVVESNSWNRLATEAFSRLGLVSLSRQHENVELVNLSTSRSVTTRLPTPSHFKLLRLPSIFLEYDYFITMPKLKTMFPTTISCALKNQFGCLPERYKSKYHPYLDNIILNLNLLIRPDLCVVDGLVGSDAEPKKMDVLMLSNDPVANDTYAAQIMGFSPWKIHHIVTCNRMGVGRMTGINVSLNEDLQTLQKQFKYLNPLAQSLGAFGFWINRRANQLQGIGNSLVNLTLFSSASLKYTRREILRMTVSPSKWKLVWNKLRS